MSSLLKIRNTSQTTPEEAAAEWWVLLDKGPLSRREQRKFEAWLAESEEHRRAFEQMQNLWQSFNGVAETSAGNALLKSAFDEPPVRRTRLPLAIAASALLALLVGTFVFRNGLEMPGIGSEPSATATAQTSIGPPEFTTAVGEQRDLRLADGTTVTLNTASNLRVDFSDTERRIELAAGQAYFDVAHDPERPFIVVAGDHTIRALGTAFDVRLDSGATQVLLFEGEIEVARLVSNINLAELPEKPVAVHAGEGLRIEAGNLTRLEHLNAEKELKWRAGLIVFDNEPLQFAAAEFNRYTHRTIVADASISDLRVSGVFRADKPENFVDAVEQLLPVVANFDSSSEIRLSATAN